MRVLTALFVAGLSLPAQAQDCTRFMHSDAPFAVQFEGGAEGKPVTSWPTLLVGITIVPSHPKVPRRFELSDCGPIGFTCYRNVADPSDTFAFRVGDDGEGQPWLEPLNDEPKRVYFQACEVLADIAKDDAARVAAEQ